MNCTEKFVNTVQQDLIDKGFQIEEITKIINIVRSRLTSYSVQETGTDLIVPGDPVPPLVKEFIAVRIMEGLSQKTIEHYKRVLKDLFIQLKKMPSDVQANDLRAYMLWYQSSHEVSSSTLNCYLRVIKNFFTWAYDSDYVQRNPAKQIKTVKCKKVHKSALCRKDVAILESVCKTKQERAILLFFLSTGCRISEVAGARISDINWDKRSIKILGKGNKERITWINDRAVIALKDYIKYRGSDDDHIFVHERSPHTCYTTCGIRKIINDLCQRVSEPLTAHLTPHILRHTAGTLALESGMPIQEVQQFLGHENISTTMTYIDVSEDRTAASHAKYVT